jgi:hypothetical protein
LPTARDDVMMTSLVAMPWASNKLPMSQHHNVTGSLHSVLSVVNFTWHDDMQARLQQT